MCVWTINVRRVHNGTDRLSSHACRAAIGRGGRGRVFLSPFSNSKAGEPSVVDRTNMRGSVKLDRLGLWFFEFDDCRLDSKLKLSLCRPIELLIDGWISAVKDDV